MEEMKIDEVVLKVMKKGKYIYREFENDCLVYVNIFFINIYDCCLLL